MSLKSVRQSVSPSFRQSVSPSVHQSVINYTYQVGVVFLFVVVDFVLLFHFNNDFSIISWRRFYTRLLLVTSPPSQSRSLRRNTTNGGL